MLTVSEDFATAHLEALVDKVEAGEEVIITGDGRPAAYMRRAVSLDHSVTPNEPLDFEALAALRASLPPLGKDSATLTREMRDDEE